MCRTLCEGLYIGEIARPVRLRFAEHYRDAKTLVAKSPWGGRYRSEHRESVKALIRLCAFPLGADSRNSRYSLRAYVVDAFRAVISVHVLMLHWEMFVLLLMPY